MNKNKIINDPVHGFIHIHNELIFDLIQHPYFQRLRRIRQLGLAEYIYPGATHTRFHHALGAMHLMGMALNSLREKKVEISAEEYEASLVAILLHDVGHGPMSHALEFTLLKDISHETISSLMMKELNAQFNNRLSLAIAIFNDAHPRHFFHQLVSSQLDMDRLDYLQRDCFFTGVIEGKIGSDRIIKLLNVKDDKLVVEEKGIYSIENFLTARRLMYWQVYLHKTNLSIEQMLLQIFGRAKYLAQNKVRLETSRHLDFLLTNHIGLDDFSQNPQVLEAFAALDDSDALYSIKCWATHPDLILSSLCKMLIERRLFKIQLSSDKNVYAIAARLSQALREKLHMKQREINYFVVKGAKSNEAYLAKGEKINILTKKGEVLDIAQASDLPNIKALRKIVKKFFVCWANFEDDQPSPFNKNVQF